MAVLLHSRCGEASAVAEQALLLDHGCTEASAVAEQALLLDHGCTKASAVAEQSSDEEADGVCVLFSGAFFERVV